MKDEQEDIIIQFYKKNHKLEIFLGTICMVAVFIVIATICIAKNEISIINIIIISIILLFYYKFLRDTKETMYNKIDKYIKNKNDLELVEKNQKYNKK